MAALDITSLQYSEIHLGNNGAGTVKETLPVGRCSNLGGSNTSNTDNTIY
jgi:hypothetical protein